MAGPSPIVLVPGLGSTLRTHRDILPALWLHGTVAVANHIRDETIEAIAGRVLAKAPSAPFSLIGHSLGGFACRIISSTMPRSWPATIRGHF